MQNEDDNPINIDWGLDKLHKKLLQILLYMDEFCTNNHIQYCLAYGTALGAVRHKGFIPWDDDVDIYMPYKDYTIFRELFNEKGNKDLFYLQELGAVDSYVTVAKLRMNGTTFIEPIYDGYDMHHGIYIDIFILFDAPESDHKRRNMLIANQYLLLKGLSNRRYKRNKKYLPLLFFLRLFPKNFLRYRAYKYLHMFCNDMSDTFFDVDMRIFKRSFYEKKLLFPAKKVSFNGVMLNGPANIDKYLRMQYGDYMQIPTIESIKHSQHALNWDPDSDFRKYMYVTNLFADEKGWKKRGI